MLHYGIGLSDVSLLDLWRDGDIYITSPIIGVALWCLKDGGFFLFFYQLKTDSDSDSESEFSFELVTDSDECTDETSTEYCVYSSSEEAEVLSEEPRAGPDVLGVQSSSVCKGGMEIRGHDHQSSD